MTTEVIIPTMRVANLDAMVASFRLSPPDVITLVTNLRADQLELRTKVPFEVRALRFRSDRYPVGKWDVSLRRNVGGFRSEADTLCFFDDDQIAGFDFIGSGLRALAKGLGPAAWGSYRFISFEGRDLYELPMEVPHAGRPRELPGRQGAGLWHEWHMWTSAYGGVLFIPRERFLSVSGFDMLFTGGSGEDQNLALRLGMQRLVIHEPPFAWHPEERVPSLPEPNRTACAVCVMVDETVNDVAIVRCRSCSYVERKDLSKTPETGPVLRFEPEGVSSEYERLT